MITSIAAFLDQLIAVERKRIDAFGVVHGPTIGTMYEGLAKDVLERAIPPGLDLRVTSGFIEGANGARSRQIDCMLVTGEGVELPFGAGSIWPASDVLATIEIKKNLYRADLTDALAKTSDVYDLIENEVRKHLDEGAPIGAAMHGFALFRGRKPRKGEIPDADLAMLQCLAFDMYAPVRMVFGYDGYATEESLRSAFVDIIEKSSPMPGPMELPHLVAAGQNSLLRLNGMPFVGVSGTDRWDLMASCRENPLRLLIELVWTKLATKFGLRMEFDDTLQMESLARLISAEFVADPDRSGWKYHALEFAESQLRRRRPENWSPQEVELDEQVFLFMLCERGQAKLTDQWVADYALNSGVDLRALIDGLVDKRLLIWLGNDYETVTTLHEQYGITMTPYGKVFVAPMEDERYGLWMAEDVKRYHEGN